MIRITYYDDEIYYTAARARVLRISAGLYSGGERYSGRARVDISREAIAKRFWAWINGVIKMPEPNPLRISKSNTSARRMN